MLRELIKSAGLRQWEVAEAAGVSEFTIIRWLRHPTADQQARIVAAIKRLQAEAASRGGAGRD